MRTNANLPIYDSARYLTGKDKTGLCVVRDMNQLQAVFAIRAAAFMAGQDCPYDEEFDGNDFTATHMLAYRQGEPIGTIRARYFSTFVKAERLSVLPRFRKSTAAFELVRGMKEFCREKGFVRFYGHAQEGLEKFWSRFGERRISTGRKFAFSDRNYTEMILEIEPHENPITYDSNPYRIISPEGMWDVEGVLEQSAKRGAQPSGY